MAGNEETRPDGHITIFDYGPTGDGDITVAMAEATLLDDAQVALAEGGGQGFEVYKGATLLNTYRVESEALQGGYGSVWRVHHTGWNVDLAVKQPRAEKFRSTAQKAAFINECDRWINLGLHPHIVSCYYVRDLGGIPTVFAEWMSGGSLRDWLRDGRLYTGDTPEALERVMNIAIQFARGLQYAHEHMLVHRDVKPDNLMLTPDGSAKVSDFGLADAGHGLTDFGAYTPAYCSPEQHEGRATPLLAHRTDIYSWAVSVLEMFMGQRPWNHGEIVGYALEEYLDMELRVPLPQAMADLLKVCLQPQPEQRGFRTIEKPEQWPGDFADIEARLREIYRETLGEPYPHEKSRAAADTADSLNNRALSFLDIAKPAAAETCWEKAITVDTVNPAVRYNRALYLWRQARIDDQQALAEVKNAYEYNSGNETAAFLYASMAMAQGAAARALKLLEGQSSAEAAALRRQAEQWPAPRTETELTAELADMLDTYAQQGLYPAQTRHDRFLYTQTLKMFDAEYEQFTAKAKASRRQTGKDDRLDFLCLSPDGRYGLRYATAGKAERADFTLELFDYATEKCLFTWPNEALTLSACFSHDGKYVSILCNNRKKADAPEASLTMKVWDTANGRNICDTTVGDLQIRSACAAPNGSRFLTGDETGVLRLFDAVNGKCLWTLPGSHQGPISNMCFSPEGSRAAIQHITCQAPLTTVTTLWNTVDWRPIASFPEAKFYALRFSPDGRYFTATTKADRNLFHVKICDAANGVGLCTYFINEKSAPVYMENIPVTTVGLAVGYSPFGDGFTALRIGARPEFHLPLPPPMHSNHNWYLSRVVSVEELARRNRLLAAVDIEVRELLQNMDVDGALAAFARGLDIPSFGASDVRQALDQEIRKYCRIKGIRSIRARRDPGFQKMADSRVFSQNRQFACLLPPPTPRAAA